MGTTERLKTNNSKILTIPNALGLHARAAAKIAHLAQKAQGLVLIGNDVEEVDATSILDVIGLYCPQGSRVKVRITHPGDTPVLDGIARLIETGFGEL